MYRIGVICILASFLALPTRAQEPIPLVTGKGAALVTFGFGSLRLNEFNDFIEDRERLLQSYGVPLEWETMRTGFEFGGALAYRATDYVGFGLEGNYQFKSNDTRFSDITGKLIDVMKVQFFEFDFFLDFWIPQAPHYNLGLHVGRGFGSFRDDVEYTDNTTPANSFEYDDEFTGEGMTSGVFIGYRKPYGQGAQLMAKIGYRMRDIGELEKNGRPVVDLLGDPISFDFSGFYARIGLGLNLF